MKIISIVLFILFAIDLPAQTNLQNTGETYPAIAIKSSKNLSLKLDSIATSYLNTQCVAGFSVSIIKEQDTLLNKAYGKAHIGLNVDTQIDSKYQVMNTVALGVLLMMEVENGEIDLDENITDYLPDFPWQGKKVTLRQLMNSTSGIPSFLYLGDPLFEGLAIPKSISDITSLFKDLPYENEPGEEYNYTVSGYVLAGVILERITKKSFSELITERIIGPLQLEETTYCQGIKIIDNLAEGYDCSYNNNLLLPNPSSSSIYPFSGSICSSSRDFLKFLRALREEKLISKKSFKKMLALTPTTKGALDQYGLTSGFGLSIGKLRDVKWFGDYITSWGYSTSFKYFPDHSLDVVVISNSSSSYQIADHISNRLVKSILNFPIEPLKKVEKKNSHKAIPISESEILSYKGTYFWNQLQRTVEIYQENGRLMYKEKGGVPYRLKKQTTGDFNIKNGQFQSLRFDKEKGEIDLLMVFKNRVIDRAEKVKR